MSGGCPLCGARVSSQLALPIALTEKRGSLASAILRLLRDLGAGLTCEEISGALRAPVHVVAARVRGLALRGDLVRVVGDTGSYDEPTTPVLRRTKSGRLAQVWRAAPKVDADVRGLQPREAVLS